MAQQLGFDLPVREALGRDDFLVAPSNAVALSMVEAWRTWPMNKLVLSGPEGAGKTHLAHVWAAETGAQILPASKLNQATVDAYFDGPVAVEDVDRIATDTDRQTALFHMHNALQAAGHPLLMTGTIAPSLWQLSLPDLQSRVDAAGHAALDAPDDSLLAAVLAKLFADRQLAPRPDVIPYLVTHMERSFAAARRVVADIDADSLARQKPVTRALAAACLDNQG
ncbi:DnaA/Hda family protein [uncultured Tateyamaria sp.]|uniref:DnaA/Hda family protein n=1 Tax=uncultured Tateyamaria sp. TaxID=455651 RepID=UPI0026207416|nr:DnaA/Hda family protein [uncultured Tateyamaria sp.]